MPQISSNGVDIHYETRGTGPPVVLLHSFLCSGSMWAGQVSTVAEMHRVINIDARGHGASGPAHAPFSLYDALDDVIAVLDTEHVDRCVWAGLSIGGMVALRAALRFPERVTGLLLLDTAAGIDPLRNRIKFRALGVAARLVGLRPLVPQTVHEMFGPTAQREQPELVRTWTESYVRADVPSALQMLRALRTRDDLTARLSEITIPAAVLVGAEDHSLPPRVAQQLADGLPNATYEEIPHAGHLTALEQPEAVSRAMLRFLETHGV